MDRSEFMRKGFHLSSPIWLAWYWIPPDTGIGVPKTAFLVLFLCGALLVEAARLISGRPFPGMRGYEADRISAYAWGSLGLALGLLFLPGELVIMTFWGMAWIDPLCLYTRKRGGYPYIPFLGYVLLAVVLSIAIVPTAPYQTVPLSWSRIAVCTPLAAAVAVAVEKPNLKHVDDDFLMNVAPLLVLAFVSALWT